LPLFNRFATWLFVLGVLGIAESRVVSWRHTGVFLAQILYDVHRVVDKVCAFALCNRWRLNFDINFLVFFNLVLDLCHQLRNWPFGFFLRHLIKFFLVYISLQTPVLFESLDLIKERACSGCGNFWFDIQFELIVRNYHLFFFILPVFFDLHFNIFKHLVLNPYLFTTFSPGSQFLQIVQSTVVVLSIGIVLVHLIFAGHFLKFTQKFFVCEFRFLFFLLLFYLFAPFFLTASTRKTVITFAHWRVQLKIGLNIVSQLSQIKALFLKDSLLSGFFA
jgi:hypothetical protein